MASGVVDPFNFPQTWDVILIGQSTSPGICQVSEAKRRHEWDRKKGKGAYGATITYVGRPPAEFNVKFLLWSALHFQQWEQFRPALKYDPSKKNPQAVDIYHPSLADIDISSVVTESIGNIIHEGDGLYALTVEFLEYFPPPARSAVGTPTQSQTTQGGLTFNQPSPQGIQPQSAQDAQQAEIGTLLQKAQQP